MRLSLRRPANVRRSLETLIFGGERRRRLLLVAWSIRSRTAKATILPEALRLSARLTARGHFATARRVCREAELALPPGSARLRLQLHRAAIDLTDGKVPDDLTSTISDALAAADERFEHHDDRAAAHVLDDVFAVAFHPATHFHGHASPLAADPDAFLKVFRASRAFTALTSVGDQGRPSRPATPATRLLFVSLENWNFIRDIIDDYRDVDGLEVRTVDLKDLPAGPWSTSPGELISRRLSRSRGTRTAPPPPDVLEPFLWADVVFVEWGHRALAWTSLLPPLRARLVTRVHSYEVHTAMPFVTDWSAVDDVIFVAPAIRALAETAVPGITSGPRRHTIANRNLLDRFDRPKSAGAERTVALIGWNSVTKDPLWALDVLDKLREDDDAWRLVLIGHEFRATGLTGTTDSYRRELDRRIASMGAAVGVVPFTDDVPAALTRVGVILSSSRREGTHEALIQGAASGALPVVRDWPYLSRWGGPRALFPASWVVTSPEEAASRILTVSTSPDRLAQIDACRQYVMDQFDYARVRAQLDEVILTPLPDGTAGDDRTAGNAPARTDDGDR